MIFLKENCLKFLSSFVDPRMDRRPSYDKDEKDKERRGHRGVSKNRSGSVSRRGESRDRDTKSRHRGESRDRSHRVS